MGLGRRTEPVGLVPGDAPSARWELDVTVRAGPDGELDFRGPFVHGNRGERCLSLRWGDVTGEGMFELFRAAKLRLSDVEPSVVREAQLPGRRHVALRPDRREGLPPLRQCAAAGHRVVGRGRVVTTAGVSELLERYEATGDEDAFVEAKRLYERSLGERH